MRRKSPIAIQQWVDSLPIPPTEPNEHKNDTSTSSRTNDMSDNNCSINNSQLCASSSIQDTPTHLTSVNQRGILSRDASFQSDDASSHCSSVESVLELRRPDPEEILMSLGFGPSLDNDEIARIPKRFLVPSKLPGVDIEKFLRQQREAKEAALSYYWPQMLSSLNIGRDYKDIPLTKDSEPSS